MAGYPWFVGTDCFIQDHSWLNWEMHYNMHITSLVLLRQVKHHNAMLASEEAWCYCNLPLEASLGSPLICSRQESTKVSSNTQSPHKHSPKPWVSAQLHCRTSAPQFTCSKMKHMAKFGQRRNTQHLTGQTLTEPARWLLTNGKNCSFPYIIILPAFNK